jgi:hypothetical protein
MFREDRRISGWCGVETQKHDIDLICRAKGRVRLHFSLCSFARRGSQAFCVAYCMLLRSHCFVIWLIPWGYFCEGISLFFLRLWHHYLSLHSALPITSFIRASCDGMILELYNYLGTKGYGTSTED